MKYLFLTFLLTGLIIPLAAAAAAPGDTEFPFARATFVLTQAMANVERVEIFEGLPRSGTGSDTRQNAKSGRKIAHQWFYSVPDEIRFKHVMKLQRLVDGGLLVPWREGKLCGDFHADYAIALTFPKVTYYVLFCFTCHEARFIREGNPFAAELESPDFRVTMDISDRSFEELRSLLSGYHKPEREGGAATGG